MISCLAKLYERTKETAEAVGFYENMLEIMPHSQVANY
jgi:hypothetical protein